MNKILNKNNFILSCQEIIKNHNEKALNIAFAADHNYVKFTGIAIYSIIENNQSEYLHFHLFITQIDQDDIDKLKKLGNDKINITLYYINTDFFNDLPICGHFSTAIYYRIAIPNILSHLDKILYLDTDILCLGSLIELYEINIQDNIVVCVEDYLMDNQHLQQLGMSPQEGYFNSGVLLINIKQWNEQNIFEKFCEIINKINIGYPDQDALNLILKDKKILINKKFNWIEWNIYPEKLTLTNPNIILVHFVGEIKPWHEVSDNAVYDYFKEKSPWAKINYLPPNNTRLFRKFSKRLWKKGRFIKAIKYQFIYLYRKIRKK